MLEERKALRKRVVGTYEFQEDGDIGRVDFNADGLTDFDPGNASELRNQRWNHAGGPRWEIISSVELHLQSNPVLSDINIGLIGVYRINKDGSLTFVAIIRDEEREEVPKDKQLNFKKIK